ncbi:MAG TPA: hypothetical protein VF875_18065 [Anaeromyxobacter sp.]
MWERVPRVLQEGIDRLGAVLADDLPGIVGMLIVVVAAIGLAFVVRAALRFALARVGFDRRAREWGMTGATALEPHHAPSWLVARGAFWTVIATGVALALAVLGASATSSMGLALLAFLPKLVVAAVVLLAGIGAGRFVERSVLIGAVNQGIRRAKLVAWAVKWLVFVLAGAMALQHCEIGGALPTIAFTIVVGGAVLAAALAVGLGARAAVARSLDRHPEREDGGDDPGDADRIHHL